MNGVVLNAAGPLFADGAWFGVGRISGTHQLAEIGDRIFFFQREHDNWAARHEVRERTKEWPAGMDCIELFGLVFGDFQFLQAKNAESSFFNLSEDVADGVFSHGV